MKKIILIIFILILILTLLYVLYSIYMLYRFNKVYDYTMSKIKDGGYYKLPSYDTMMWSIKPLKDKYWIK